ncbi:MAG: hydrogenase accessory protein HupE [Gammaproteobacteria bacterium]|nr:hydrogenase accessory protein HupE [Gammaproteobacteria bacterium]
MNGLPNIPVTVINSDFQDQEDSPEITENVRALLTEISSMLSALINDDKTDIIDLHSLPLLIGEHDAIKTILGQGEIQASLDSLGSSTIYETALSGVWWISHHNENGDCIAETIEITTIPKILESQQADIEIAQQALKEQLEDWIDQ